MRKGWFTIPGVQHGDRTEEEQMLGLAPALAAVRGKTVLDLGCAEGLISLAFARAGAARVVGIESVKEHLVVARRLARDVPNVEFVHRELRSHIDASPTPEQFDFVLILGIIHKLHEPQIGGEFAVRSARELVLFRAPARATDGKVRSKFHPQNYCDMPPLMAAHGFVEEGKINGVRGESVQYWRKHGHR